MSHLLTHRDKGWAAVSERIKEKVAELDRSLAKMCGKASKNPRTGSCPRAVATLPYLWYFYPLSLPDTFCASVERVRMGSDTVSRRLPRTHEPRMLLYAQGRFRHASVAVRSLHISGPLRLSMQRGTTAS